MTGDRIRYRLGYRFQLINDYRVRVDVFPDHDIETEMIMMDRSGVLTIRHGFAWDGPSDPFLWLPMPRRVRRWLLRKFMRGSLVHDALAQLMRDAWLERDRWFKPINRELQKICIEDGMWRLRALCVFLGVQYLGGKRWTRWGDGGKHLCEAP
jgi:hypothetical protein